MGDLWSTIIAYLLGSVPTGFLLVRIARSEDIREVGSGNIGATNVLRVMGLAAGLLVLAIDAGKAYLAVWLAGKITASSTPWMAASAVAAMLGNAYPVFLRFRGGKTVGTFAGAFLCLAPLAVGAVLLVFLGTAAITRHISAGSIMIGISFPLAVWLVEHPPSEVLVASLAAGALIVWRHRDNIRRLRAGREYVFEIRGARR